MVTGTPFKRRITFKGKRYSYSDQLGGYVSLEAGARGGVETDPAIYRAGRTELPSVETTRQREAESLALDEFAQGLLSQGRTPTTEQTLRSRGLSEVDIAEFFTTPLTPAEIAEVTPIAPERIQTLLEAVFPGRTTGDLQTDLGALGEFISTQPEAFLEDIRTLGRTPDTEAFLTTVFPDITRDELTEILGPVLFEGRTPQAVLGLEPEWENVRTGEVITESEKARRYPKGFEPELDDWRLTVETGRNYWNVFKVFGESLTKLPKQLGASILQAIQGHQGASAVDKDWADRQIDIANKDLDEFAQKVTEEYKGLRLPIPLSELATLPQNMAFSLTSMFTGLAVGVPIALIPEPTPASRIAAWAAGTAASGLVAFNMSSYQIMQTYLEVKNEEMKAAIGRELTLAEEDQLKKEFTGLAIKYGLWEAVPEALSNLAFARLLTLPLGKMVGRNIATQIITKVTGIYGAEFLTETITQKGQSGIEVEAGLREGKITWIEAFKEIFIQTFLLTTVLGGLGQVGVSSVNRIRRSLKKEAADKGIIDSPLYDTIKENITEDVFAEVEAESTEKIEEAKPLEVPEVTLPKGVPKATLSLEEITKLETRIPLDLIRKDEPQTIERLTEQIKREGITEPITIRVRADGSRIVWDGIHRLIVAQDLGIKNVPVQFIGEKGERLAKPPEVTPEVSPIVPKVKEPWQMTKQEYKQHLIETDIETQRFIEEGFEVDVGKEHADIVSKAIKEGKPVPDNVKAQYPQLVPSVIAKPAQSWKMTKQEFIGKATTKEAIDFKAGVHERAVKKALSEGKPVPAEVLADYPDLKPPAVEKPVVEEVPPERVIYTEDGTPINPEEPIPQGVGDTIPVIQDIGAKERVRPTRKVFEKMGLYRLYKGIQRAEVEVGEARQSFAKRLKEVNKLVDKNRRHLVFRELETPGSQAGLTFNEKRAVAFFRESFDKWADTLNLPQSKRIKNYITHIFEADITEQLKAEQPLDISIARALEYRTAKTIFNPFLQERLGARAGLIEDPFAAASAYESRELKVLYYEPLLEKIASIANDENTPTAVRGYLRDFSDRMTGKPSKFDLEMNTTIQEFADKIRGLPGGNALADIMSRGNPSGMASYNFTSMLYTLWLGFKPTSAIRNLSQHTLIIGEVGPIHFADGIRLRFTEEGKVALNESLVWRSRRAAFLPGIDDSFASRWSDQFRETALFMFRQADAQNVKDAFLAGYSEAKSLLPDADKQVWIDRGDEVAADTQYLYTKMNSFSLSQSSIGRVFSILTTWSVNWMELMNKWVSRRPSQVYLEYEKATGTKIKKGNWSTSYKAILIYMLIIGLGYLIKEQTRVKAWEYTGITSIRYLAGVAGGDFPGLQAPGAVANLIAGFLTDDERRLKQGWSEIKSTFTPGILRQIEDVATGEKDWLTLLFYLEGKDYKLRQLKDKWEKGWKEYEALAPKDRDDYRKGNPLIEAQMFVTGRFTTLSSDKARAEVLRLIEEHKLDTELIKGYEKVFGVDTDKELADKKRLLGTVELTEEGGQKLKENGELDYFTTSNFASEVNRLEKVVGRYKIINDGNALAIEYLNAKDLWVAYEDFTDEGARILYRQQFPDVEAQLYLWGKISTFKNPKSAEILLGLMDKYGIPPESIPAFLDNPEKYDELFTQKFELEKKWFALNMEYENYGNSESPLYIEDKDVRKEAREKLRNDNPNWVLDSAKLEAIDHEATDRIVESWAEREKLTIQFGSSSSEAKVWLIDNPEVHKWALEQGLLTDDGSDWNEKVLRLNVELRGLDEGSEQWRLLNYKKNAFEVDFNEQLIDTYVEWYNSPGLKKPEGWDLGWYEDDWFLMENQAFYKEMLAKVFKERRDFRKVPSREVFDLWVIYNNLPSGSVRKDYRLAHSDLDDWLVRAKGYKPAEGEISDLEGLSGWEKTAKRGADLLKRARELGK